MTTTIFSAVERCGNEVIRQQFFSTKLGAQELLSQWIADGWSDGREWKLNADGQWENESDGKAFVLVVEEHVLNQEAAPVPTWPDYPVYPSFPSFEPIKELSDCLHDNCPTCHGTGISRYGGACIHHLVCHCPKCQITCGTVILSQSSTNGNDQWGSGSWNNSLNQ